MDFKKFNEIAELVGILAIVASLIFVGLELRQSDKIAKAEVLADYIAMSTEKNAAIIAEPDIWLRGNAGEELTDAEQVVFEHQVRNETDRAWFAVEQYILIGYKDFIEGDYAEFALFLYEHPGARKVWIEREKARTVYFAALLNTDGEVSEFNEKVLGYLSNLEAQFGQSTIDAE